MERYRDRGGDYIEGDNISIVWFFFNKGLEHESGFFIATPRIMSNSNGGWFSFDTVCQLMMLLIAKRRN